MVITAFAYAVKMGAWGDAHQISGLTNIYLEFYCVVFGWAFDD